ncbi:MAG: TonB-dependent receptor [Gemmatirosa sp.]
MTIRRPSVMPRAMARCLVAALAMGAVVAPAASQEPRPAAPRDSAARADSAHRLRTRRIDGTRLAPEAADRHGQRIDRATPRITGGGPAALAEVLTTLPGVSLFDDQGTRAQPTLDVRGFAVSPVVGVAQGVSVFLDGVRVNEGDAQQVNFDLLPMEAIQSVALVRGPSALFGRNTLGGTLHLATRRGEATPTAEIEADAGPFGYRGARLSAGGRASGMDGFVMARTSREDGWRDATGAVRQLAFGTVGRETARGDLALSALLARDSLMQAGSLPESWFGSPRRNYTGGDYFRPVLAHVALRGRRVLGAPEPDGEAVRVSELRGHVYGRRNRSVQFNVNAGAPSTRAHIGTTSGGGTVELALPLRAAGRPLELTTGLEYVRNAVRYRVFQEPTDEAPTLDPDDCDVATALCENAAVDEDDVGAFAQAALALTPALTITAAARGDWVRVPFVDRRDGENSERSIFRAMTPSLGLDWRPTPRVRAYASVGAGFRAPAALELACADEESPCPLPFSLGDDPPLEPVRVRNVELGGDWEPQAGVRLTASAFRADIRDEIALVMTDRREAFFQNVSRTRRQGMELTASAGDPTRLARARGSWVWVDARFRSSARTSTQRDDAPPVETGDRMPLSPAHRAFAALDAVRTLRGVAVTGELSMRALSSQVPRGGEGDEAGLLPGYALAGARAGLSWRHVSADLHVSNPLDRRAATFGIWGENDRSPDGTPFVGGERVERFLSPAYPRSVTLAIGLRR